MDGYITQIDSKTATEFILPRHYAGRVPSISIAFGWYHGGKLVAVCTFGKPATPWLCKGICGDAWASNVYELNRLCRLEDWTAPLSHFVATCLRRLKSKNWIIVSYSDTAMNHHGYIYQACNFLYTGMTKERTDLCSDTQKHGRHYDHENISDYRKVRSAKHRYVYFCTSSKKLKKKWLSCLSYPIMPYPKGDNSADYTLGVYMQELVVSSDGEQHSISPNTPIIYKAKSLF